MSRESYIQTQGFASFAVGVILRWPNVGQVVIVPEINGALWLQVHCGERDEFSVYLTRAELMATDNPWELIAPLRAQVFAAAGMDEELSIWEMADAN